MSAPYLAGAVALTPVAALLWIGTLADLVRFVRAPASTKPGAGNGAILVAFSAASTWGAVYCIACLFGARA